MQRLVGNFDLKNLSLGRNPSDNLKGARTMVPKGAPIPGTVLVSRKGRQRRGSEGVGSWLVSHTRQGLHAVQQRAVQR